ncbi:hypothetical protein GMC90_03625 [Streptococcus parasanguinis]|uniref:Lipoprotein n=2 Tax=Streptococcus parasanguinis TaxID=1318 RepID=A0A6A8V4G3_STRPA|nr:hypothetical protein [Streptococcus parasanguinis]EFQ55273.1 hypothetical protein HMPREF9626_0813 [Streptococcus parasanguinis F0405]MTR66216.1 hypothetical protein [Streptococcus parasanguinis]MTS00922.1 hypothetical protein [Streptococcus parasanguinis]
MKSKMKCSLKLIALMLIFTSIGGCTVKPKEQMKQDKMNVSSSTKEDTATVTQRQVDFLKKHESEITNYIKSNDPEVVRVKYDWDSVKVGDSGSFTESGFDIRLKVYGANDKELNGYSFFIVPKPNVENPISIDSISGSNFP